MTNVFEVQQEVGEGVVCKQFSTKTVSSEMRLKQEKLNSTLRENSQLPTFPLPFTCAKILCFVLAIMETIILVRAKFNIGSVLQNTTGVVLFVLGLIGYIGVIILQSIQNKKYKEHNQKLYEETKTLGESILQESQKELGLPNNLIHIDVFYALYTDSMSLPKHYNVSMSAFIEDNKLCLANLEEVFSFDLSKLKFEGYIPEKRQFYGWNKPDSFRSDKYLPYNLKSVGGSLYTTSSFARLTYQMGEEQFYIEVAPYDGMELGGLLQK